jgi:hypothetical protein
MPGYPNTDTEYSINDLLAMSDERFGAAATANLHATTRWKSPFQQPDIVQRTLHALVEKLWFTDSQIGKKAEDPTYPIEQYERTLSFRRHLLASIDLTERRASNGRQKEAQAWRALLHEVCDEIEGDDVFDEILDEFFIPFAGERDGGPKITLRQWIEIRRIKEPSRVKEKAVAA